MLIHFLNSLYELRLAIETIGYPPIDCIFALERTFRLHKYVVCT